MNFSLPFHSTTLTNYVICPHSISKFHAQIWSIEFLKICPKWTTGTRVLCSQSFWYFFFCFTFASIGYLLATATLTSYILHSPQQHLHTFRAIKWGYTHQKHSISYCFGSTTTLSESILLNVLTFFVRYKKVHLEFTISFINAKRGKLHTYQCNQILTLFRLLHTFYLRLSAFAY